MKTKNKHIDTNTIRKLTDYVLLNAYSIDTTGLYNGKSGLSLSLFELASHFQDERLADHAFELMQESLLTRNKDISFEAGLSGIGFFLLHIIKHHPYAEIDFEELFQEKREQINQQLEILVKDKETNLRHIQILSYLSALENRRNQQEESLSITIIAKALEQLDDLLNQIKPVNSTIPKLHLQERFGTLLCQLYEFDNYENTPYDNQAVQSLCKRFARLYTGGFLVSHYPTGYFLHRRAVRSNDKNLAAAARSIMDKARQNIYPPAMRLRQKTDLLFLLDKNKKENQTYTDALYDSIWQSNDKTPEQTISANINPQEMICGYGQGIARLLTYWVYRASAHTPQNTTRFNILIH